MRFHLLTTNNAKTSKGEARGWRTASLELLPAKWKTAKEEGDFSVCPTASAKGYACTKQGQCVAFAGFGAMPSVVAKRAQRKRFWKDDPTGFYALLQAELITFAHQCKRDGVNAAVRLNTFSDLPHHKHLNLASLSENHNIVFYDYSKELVGLEERLATGWRITVSAHSADSAVELCREYPSLSVSVAFNGELPERFEGRVVIDGDRDDLRFLDPVGCVVGLRGKAGMKSGGGITVDASRIGVR